MQAPRSDLLDAHQTGEFLATARDVIDDSHTRTVLTVDGETAASVNLEAGTVTRTKDADTVNALRREVTIREIQTSGGALQRGDRVYLIDQADLTTALKSTATLVDGTDRLEVLEWGSDPFDAFHVVTARVV